MGKILLILLIILSFFLGMVFGKNRNSSEIKTPISKVKSRPLDKYTIENLSKRKPRGSNIVKERILEENEDFVSNLFSFKTENKKVTGQMNIPRETDKKYAVIVMFRGYVDQSLYITGMGTKRAAEFFAKNGFITIAPDFLGYGESDPQSGDIFEARFQTYTTALDLINSIMSIREWNQKDIFLWGHSNGGQIALTILEITGVSYPTALWAPVSKPFPYSVLYYTDESEDGGKLVRRELAIFEEFYDPDLYSIHKYYDRIGSPIQIHQGTSDDAVPKSWSDTLVKALPNSNYYVYPNNNHNLSPSWDIVVSRDLEFYQKNL